MTGPDRRYDLHDKIASKDDDYESCNVPDKVIPDNIVAVFKEFEVPVYAWNTVLRMAEVIASLRNDVAVGVQLHELIKTELAYSAEMKDALQVCVAALKKHKKEWHHKTKGCCGECITICDAIEVLRSRLRTVRDSRNNGVY